VIPARADVIQGSQHVMDARSALCARRKSRGSRGERSCKRFHDVELLPSSLCELRQRRCKRFHDVEPLPSTLYELRQRSCTRFHDVEPLPSSRYELRQRSCRRFHDVEPLPSTLLQLRERRPQDGDTRSPRREGGCNR